MEDSNPRMSPPINIKDEPIDEGYDAALLPQSSIRQIKEELEQEVGMEQQRYQYYFLFIFVFSTRCIFVIIVIIN